MRILFLLESFYVGGVERVTVKLANKFVKESHQVFIYCFSRSCTILENNLSDHIHVLYGNGRRNIHNNINNIRNLIAKNKIDIVINQNGVSIFFAFAMYYACKGADVQTISVYHNSPNHRTRVDLLLDQTKCKLNRLILIGKRKCLQFFDSRCMKYAYNHSDYYMLLSNSFISDFVSYTKVNNIDKLLIQTNPICIDKETVNVQPLVKSNTILYVGRFEECQKRILRILHLWSILEEKLCDWNLKLVGDGPDRALYESFVKEKDLKRVYFEGYKNPLNYYEESKILLLTSDFEGYGLVLSEGMSLGSIPIVLATYSSVYDIVENGKDGFIMQPPFNLQAWSDKIIALVNNKEKMDEMSKQAILDSQKFDIDVVYTQWLKILTSIRKNV